MLSPWRFPPLLVLLLFTGLTSAADASGLNERTFQHYATLLESHLQEKTLDNDGLVSAFDYQAALDDSASKELLAQQDALLAEFDTSQLDNREQAIAFWNNAYNYFMIQKVLTDLRRGKLVESVWDYGGRYNPLRASVFEREDFTIGGEKYSLNTMEKGKLLGDEFKQKGWKEARVHFTVNCASVGCPPLRKTIYTASNIDELMTDNTRRAFNTPRHLRVEGDTLYLTELFKWYEDDYVEEEGSVKAFIQAYADDPVAEKVAATSRIRFISYDWDLNTPANFPELQ
ncbi:MAG: DUF547 domain-containing protein [Halomonadaceae bacterium]|nr:MAG: DUF547 domain-containing protein [Halomonadaceae bacterium]